MRTCKHCGAPIRIAFQHYQAGWVHKAGNIWCSHTVAEPREGSESRG